MKRRFLSTILVLALILSAFAGCSSASSSSSASATSTSSAASSSSKSTSAASSAASESSSSGTGELGTEEHAMSIVDKTGDPYEVNFMYMVAGEGSDQEKVNQAVSDLAKERINMTVNMIPMTFGTYNNQISMMLASNEALDCFVAFSSSYSTYINSQYIVNAADYKDETQDIVSILGEDADCGYVGGTFLAGFGQMKERSYPAGLVVRKDLFESLGYKVSDFNVSVDDYSSFDKITEMFKKVKEKYPDMVVMDGTSTMGLQTYSYMDNLGDMFGVLENYGKTLTITNWFESDQYKKFAEINHEWFKAGYLSQDIATNTDSGEIKMKAGNTFCYMSNVKPNTDIEKLAQTGYEVVVIPCSVPMKTTSAVGGGVYSVANAAKDKSKAFQFLNWAYTSQDFEDLINWGIKGTDWTLTSDNMATFPDGVTASSVGYHNDFGWAYPNQFAGHAWTGNPTDIWDQYKKYNASTAKSNAFGFMFDPTSVETEEAQCTSIYNQYYKTVAYGVDDDTDAAIKTFNDALYTAGLQTIMDAKQKQLDTWKASK
jgi:putative aldouronate transport system substrate-binding protein